MTSVCAKVVVRAYKSVQKTIKDILSESPEIRNTKRESRVDEKKFLASELLEIGRKEFGVEITVYSESDFEIYDPKGKARHARPFKPAILIEKDESFVTGT